MFSSKKLRKRLHKWCSDNLLFTKAKDYQNGTKRTKSTQRNSRLYWKNLALILYKCFA